MSDTKSNSQIYLDPAQDIEARVSDLLNFLTIEEKAQLLKGKDFWSTNPIPRAKLPSLGMTDGPLGVAYHSSFKGIRTRFPATIGLAATWNRMLAYDMGKIMGAETKLSGRHQILAPGLNIIRSPLCGRTFEYLSEDPILSSEIGAELVKGIQEQDIAACIKHYVTNNSETKRFTISTEISERALQEIYVKNFGRVIQKADPWGLMVCYNKVNGVQGAENKYILRDILRDQLHFTGHVVTDWGAARKTHGAASCIKAGLSLEMPGKLISNVMPKKKVLKALARGEITENDIDYVLRPMLRTFFRVKLFDSVPVDPVAVIDDPSHKEVAQKIAEESIVLLKNMDNALPIDLKSTKRIAVLGPNADKKFGKMLQGGSSAAVPPEFITPLEGITQYVGERCEITTEPEKADVVILVLGLDHGGRMLRNMIFGVEGDSEGSDRTRYALPPEQEELLRDTVSKNSNTIAVLVAGSPVKIDQWYDEVPAILNAWYPGMMGGVALAKVLFGETNPSGKLPVTYPVELHDNPAHHAPKNFPGDLHKKKIFYDEGVFVGYRYFDQHEIPPQFPFGFGLSYTSFELKNLTIDRSVYDGNGKFKVNVEVTNTGDKAGAEVVQFYIQDCEASVERPPRELQAFEKVFLQPEETKTVSVEMDLTALEFYSELAHGFIAEPGKFIVHCGNSSRNLPLSVEFEYRK